MLRVLSCCQHPPHPQTPYKQVLCAAAAYPSSYGSGSGRGSSSPGGGGSGSGSGGYYSGGGSGSSVAADSSYGGSDGYGAAAAPGGALTETARASLARATAALRRWGWLSFWSQLSLGVAGGAALLFSVAFTSSTGPKAALYLTVLSMLGGFLSTFWAYGYQRTAQRMQEFLDGAAVASTKKHDVLQSLANGAAISVAAMGAAVAALAALIGSLAAKAVANATVDAAAAAAAGYDPVVALDVFLMLAAVTALLHHFVALACNLWVLNVVGEGRGLKFQRQQHIRALKEQEARADEVLRRAGVGGSSGLQL